MATKGKHVYRVGKDHPIAGKMKPGERMTARMRMLDADEASEGEGGTMPMEEEESLPYAAPAAPKKKAKTPAELVKQRREMGK